MIEYVEVTNYLNESIKIYLNDGEPESGFIISSIKGLNPPKATINLSDIATIDGGIISSERIPYRNIIISLLFSPANSIEETRLRCYKYFPIKRPLTVTIKTENRLLDTVGYVEYNEVDIFSNQESTSISIICSDPYLYSHNTTETVFNGIEPRFKFPFSNNSLTEKKLKFGDIYDTHEKNIVYTGDAETGIVITVHALGTIRNLVIYNVKTRAVMRISSSKISELTGDEIITGDDIIISSIVGNKYIRLIRGGETFNIINAIDKKSDWFTLSKGDNIIAYAAEQGEDMIKFKITNRFAYEGV